MDQARQPRWQNHYQRPRCDGRVSFGVLGRELGDTPITNVVLRGVRVEFAGGGTAWTTNQTVRGPGVDARPLPAWGLYGRNVQTLTLEDVRFSLAADDTRPVIYAERVERLNLDGFSYTQVPGVTEGLMATNGSRIFRVTPPNRQAER